MSAEINQDPQRGMLCIDIEGAASVANGGLGAILNPEGKKLGILRTYAYFETGSTGAANLDVGVGATAATKGTDILSTFDGIEATVGGKLFYCQAVPVNETEDAVIWEAGEYITFTGSASTVGLEGKMFVEYIRLD
ncbi:MAG: hypothetical protein CVU43_04510 [Chloroflexi bacterium HGW-Chloroflexi-5]|jgi:hypothetical protein|nr:MAG: hypothetical protein CVU43_04510 [Chloroflexi bacterium HGW-Chloroflexi-5]